MGTVISFTFCKHIFIEFSFISGGSFTRTTGEVRNEKKIGTRRLLAFFAHFCVMKKGVRLNNQHCVSPLYMYTGSFRDDT